MKIKKPKKVKKVSITLELDEVSVKMIEQYLDGEDTLKLYLESEINSNPEAFIEYSGLDNY
jgi:hypothetical protein